MLQPGQGLWPQPHCLCRAQMWGQDHLQSLFLLQLDQGSSPQLLRGSAENAVDAKWGFWVPLKGAAVTRAAQARGAARAHTVCEMEDSLL